MNRIPFQTIRRAYPEDLQALHALASAAAWGLCAGDYNPQQIATVLRYGLGVDDQILVDGTYYVIEAEDRIIAGGGWSRRAALLGNTHPDYDGHPLDELDPAFHPARLRGFAVHPDFARRGFARAIVALCEHAALEAGFTQLELMASLTGRRLYMACGYEDVEPMTHIFPNGVAAHGYRMAKTLRSQVGQDVWGRSPFIWTVAPSSDVA